MVFDWNFQDLIKFEQEAPDCTWMIDQLMKRSLKLQICGIIGLLREFDLNF
jgi:hypothetical protein